MLYNSSMGIAENCLLAECIGKELDKVLPLKLGVNKRNEVIRLLYEIGVSKGMSAREAIELAEIPDIAAEGRAGLFQKVKKKLLLIRYPSIEEGDDPRLMSLKLTGSDKACPIWDLELRPRKIFIEKRIRHLDWTEGFLGKIPGSPEVAEIDEIGSFAGGAGRRYTLEDYGRRREHIFVVRNKDAFVKKCPCTKKAVRCGYHVLNMGFGCPIDCSYCYLQTYSNGPGIVLPANIEDYLGYIRQMDAGAPAGTRIGTGEFTDSLALDKYTGYAGRLINFFKGSRNLILELKTKVADISGVLGTEPNGRVVISWSMNTDRIARSYEKGAAGVPERIRAARSAAQAGYKIGFHFDPIVYYNGWEEEYREIVDGLFSGKEIRDNTSWISLGTLRYTPGLKEAAERRFDDNLLFYGGEFFLGYDGKLRYPGTRRLEIYRKMSGWIRDAGVKAWIYLCMEPPEMWRSLAGG